MNWKTNLGNFFYVVHISEDEEEGGILDLVLSTITGEDDEDEKTKTEVLIWYEFNEFKFFNGLLFDIYSTKIVDCRQKWGRWGRWGRRRGWKWRGRRRWW